MHVKPGVLELYVGPMKSGKTLAAIHRVEGLNYRDDVDMVFVKVMPMALALSMFTRPREDFTPMLV